MKDITVYILANHSRRLYVGITGDLRRRIGEHRTGNVPWFTSRYRLNRLVYYEQTTNSRAAIEREKQIKAWSRGKKIQLIESMNAGWLDLAEDWFEKGKRE